MSLDLLASIAQIIGACAVVITVIYAWRQLRAMRHEQLLGAVWEIFRELDAPEKHEARIFVYQNAVLFKELDRNPHENISKLPEDAERLANVVSSSFDRVGYVVNRGLIPLSLILENFHPSIARSWVALEPYIKALRNNRYHPEHEQYFELLGIEALSHYISREEVIRELDKWTELGSSSPDVTLMNDLRATADDSVNRGGIMSVNKAAIERHETEVSIIRTSSPEKQVEYWKGFYSSEDFRFLEDPAEIGRFGIIAEIIFSFFTKPRVLDIGCGLGPLCRMFQQNKIQSYLGVDISDKAIEIARQNYPEYSFSCKRAENITIDKPQDVVVLSEVLYYMDYLAILEKAFSFLAPSGLLIASIFNSPSGNIILQYLGEQKLIKKNIEIISHDSGLVWHVLALQDRD